MKLDELIKRYQDGKIDKKVFWELSRERLLPMLEIQKILCMGGVITLNEKDIVLEKDGIKLLFDFSLPICRAEAMLTESEQEDWDFLKNFITNSSTVLDIGANVGVFSITFKRLFHSATIYSFEPIKDTFEFMKRNIALNRLDGELNVFNVGISDENKLMTFYVPPENEAASLRPVDDEFYLREGNVGQQEIKTSLKEIQCMVVRLDDFAKEHDIDKCDFIKIDVEGAELFALQGGMGFIKHTKPVIYCEMLRKHAKRFGYHPNDIITMMRTIGYTCYEMAGGKLKVFETMDDKTEQTNFFFITDEKRQVLKNELFC